MDKWELRRAFTVEGKTKGFNVLELCPDVRVLPQLSYRDQRVHKGRDTAHVSKHQSDGYTFSIESDEWQVANARDGVFRAVSAQHVLLRRALIDDIPLLRMTMPSASAVDNEPAGQVFYDVGFAGHLELLLLWQISPPPNASFACTFYCTRSVEGTTHKSTCKRAGLARARAETAASVGGRFIEHGHWRVNVVDI